jgi:hypothetical protein
MGCKGNNNFKSTSGTGEVAHTCNFSYLRRQRYEDFGLRLAQVKAPD